MGILSYTTDFSKPKKAKKKHFHTINVSIFSYIIDH